MLGNSGKDFVIAVGEAQVNRKTMIFTLVKVHRRQEYRYKIRGGVPRLLQPILQRLLETLTDGPVSGVISRNLTYRRLGWMSIQEIYDSGLKTEMRIL